MLLYSRTTSRVPGRNSQGKYTFCGKLKQACVYLLIFRIQLKYNVELLVFFLRAQLTKPVSVWTFLCFVSGGVYGNTMF